MSDEAPKTDDIVGEIHLLFRGDGQAEISTSLGVAELNLALDTIKHNLLSGELKLENV